MALIDLCKRLQTLIASNNYDIEHKEWLDIELANATDAELKQLGLQRNAPNAPHIATSDYLKSRTRLTKCYLAGVPLDITCIFTEGSQSHQLLSASKSVTSILTLMDAAGLFFVKKGTPLNVYPDFDAWLSRVMPTFRATLTVTQDTTMIAWETQKLVTGTKINAAAWRHNLQLWHEPEARAGLKIRVSQALTKLKKTYDPDTADWDARDAYDKKTCYYQVLLDLIEIHSAPDETICDRVVQLAEKEHAVLSKTSSYANSLLSDYDTKMGPQHAGSVALGAIVYQRVKKLSLEQQYVVLEALQQHYTQTIEHPKRKTHRLCQDIAAQFLYEQPFAPSKAAATLPPFAKFVAETKNRHVDYVFDKLKEAHPFIFTKPEWEQLPSYLELLGFNDLVRKNQPWDQWYAALRTAMINFIAIAPTPAPAPVTLDGPLDL